MLFEQAFDPVRSFTAAWGLLKRTPGTVLLGVLFPLIIQYAANFAGQILFMPLFFGVQNEHRDRVIPLLVVAVGLCLAVTLVQLVFQSWIDVGFARAIRAALATGTEQTQEIFRGADRLVTMLLARFVTFLAILSTYMLIAGAAIGLGVLMPPSVHLAIKIAAVAGVLFFPFAILVYVLLGLQFVTPIVALESCGAIEAIRRSWSVADGRRWRLLLFWLCVALIAFAGFLACVIGLLVALPIIETMRIEAYLALKHENELAPAESLASPA